MEDVHCFTVSILLLISYQLGHICEHLPLVDPCTVKSFRRVKEGHVEERNRQTCKAGAAKVKEEANCIGQSRRRQWEDESVGKSGLIVTVFSGHIPAPREEEEKVDRMWETTSRGKIRQRPFEWTKSQRGDSKCAFRPSDGKVEQSFRLLVRAVDKHRRFAQSEPKEGKEKDVKNEENDLQKPSAPHI